MCQVKGVPLADHQPWPQGPACIRPELIIHLNWPIIQILCSCFSSLLFMWPYPFIQMIMTYSWRKFLGVLFDGKPYTHIYFLRLYVRLEAFGAFSASRNNAGGDDIAWYWDTASFPSALSHWPTDPCDAVQRSRLDVKSVHAQTKFLLFLPIIQHLENQLDYSKFYSRTTSSGLTCILASFQACVFYSCCTCGWIIFLRAVSISLVVPSAQYYSWLVSNPSHALYN